MPFEVLDAVLALPFVRLGLAQDLRAAALGAAEVRVDVVDHYDDPVDDERSLEPLARKRAGLGMPARALICVARMTHKDRPTVELEHDVGDRPLTVVEALSFAEAEDLADPIGRETRILVREHWDDALLSHGRPPLFATNDALARAVGRGHHA